MGKVFISIPAFEMAWKKFNEEFSDLSNLWIRLVPFIHKSTMMRFKSAGPGWAKLAPSTIIRRINRGTWPVTAGTNTAKSGVGGKRGEKRRAYTAAASAGSSQPILQEYGPLRSSVMMRNAGAGGGHIEQLNKRSLIYGTYLAKAAVLQGDLDRWIPGADRRAYGHMPPRPFLFFDDADIQTVTEEAQQYVLERIEANL